MSEAALRVILGWRMLVSGISNVRRWPNGRIRCCRRNSNSHMLGDDRDISDTDLRLALALAEGLADHVTGGQCGHYR